MPRLHYLCLERLRPASAADTHVRGLLSELTARGWRTTLFADVAVDHHRPGGVRQLLRYMRLQLKAMTRLRSANIVFVRQHFASLPLVAIARLAGIPVVLELNGLPDDVIATYPYLGYLKRVITWCHTSQFRCASHVLAVTEGLAAHVRRQAQAVPVTVISNGANTDLFADQGQSRPNDAPKGSYVITFGDFALWHDLDLILRAVRDPAWPSHVKLLKIGQGSAAQTRAIPGDLADRVVWLERRTQSELAAYIIHALAGIVPISGDAGRAVIGVMPLKLFEILSCGRPAIVTDLPSQSELVRDHACGIVVPIDGAQDLAAAVAGLACDRSVALQMGLRGREIVVSRYSWRFLAGEVDTILRGLIEK